MFEFKCNAAFSEMALSNKQGSDAGGNFICFQCKGDRCVEKAFKNYQQSFKTKEISKELVNLQEDMFELNQVLRAVERCSVKYVILAEINLLSAKTDSLHDLTAANPNRKMTWSEVVA